MFVMVPFWNSTTVCLIFVGLMKMYLILYFDWPSLRCSTSKHCSSGRLFLSVTHSNKPFSCVVWLYHWFVITNRISLEYLTVWKTKFGSHWLAIALMGFLNNENLLRKNFFCSLITHFHCCWNTRKGVQFFKALLPVCSVWTFAISPHCQIQCKNVRVFFIETLTCIGVSLFGQPSGGFSCVHWPEVPVATKPEKNYYG